MDLSWQIYSLGAFYVIIMVATFIYQWKIGVLLLFLLIAIIVFILYNMNKFLTGVNVIASQLVHTIKESQEDIYRDSPIGIVIYDENQRFMWGNTTVLSIMNDKDVIGESLEVINRHFVEILALDDEEWHVISMYDKIFRILHHPDTRTIYLIDFTFEEQIREHHKFNQIVYGYLLLDDYDEVVQSLNDQEASNFDAELINELNDWAVHQDIYIKRVEDDKFMLLMNMKTLEQLEAHRFQYFTEIREKYYARNIPISMSIGISYPNEDKYQINKLAREAQMNLDLALGRGGDQVVVRSGEDVARFYGGDTNPNEKRTNTRSKLVYQALINQINQASNVLISGHKYPDMDSIGSALGIYKIVLEQRKTAKIIVDETKFNSDIQQLLNSPQINYNLKNIFTDVESAKEYLIPKTLIILVDHHRPSLSEAEDLLFMEENIVIIDHHRRSEEFPSQTVLTYIEPYASSTSELITEFFMNMRNTTEPVNRFEATALLAGIIVDTNNFSMRTGSRTFDVASYLKSRGADTAQIQRMLKEDLSIVKKRNQLIENTEYFEAIYGISATSNDEITDHVTAAQAADSMLTLTAIEASFVIYRRSDSVVGISARSMGKINVQKIMEQLGGGGHLSNAATQLTNISIEEVKEQLKNAIQSS